MGYSVKKTALKEINAVFYHFLVSNSKLLLCSQPRQGV